MGNRARSGDLDQALKYGYEALAIDRRSKPLLLMVVSGLDKALSERFSSSTEVAEFHEVLAAANRARSRWRWP